MDDFIKLPRLYVDSDLSANAPVAFGADQAHYLRHVLRRNPGDNLRVFNGRDGEWLATIAEAGKKAVTAQAVRILLPQPAAGPAIHLFFAPIKKARMDMLVEKAVELGATHLHPVITQNTEVRQVNTDRLRAQIIEAAEQCERLDIPALADAAALRTVGGLTVFAAIERAPDAPPLAAALTAHRGPCGLLVGPEGGFTTEEKRALGQNPDIVTVSLGDRTLRSETAVIFMLAAVQNSYL